MNMITTFKIFEKKKRIIYSKGDTVVCINNTDYEEIMTIGDKYIVTSLINHDYKNENMLVSVIHTRKNQEIENIFAHRFVNEEAYKEMIFQRDIKNFNL